MSLIHPELQGHMDAKASQQWADRDLVRQIVNSLGSQVVREGSELKEMAQKNNALYLLKGDHGGMTLSRPGSRVCGAPGATMTRHVLVTSDALIEGLRFEATPNGNNESTLLTIGASAVVRFHACTFHKDASMPPTFITVEAGGKAIFTACDWGGTMTIVGNVFDNAGALLDVVISGSNRTGNAVGNVTPMGLV